MVKLKVDQVKCLYRYFFMVSVFYKVIDLSSKLAPLFL